MSTDRKPAPAAEAAQRNRQPGPPAAEPGEPARRMPPTGRRAEEAGRHGLLPPRPRGPGDREDHKQQPRPAQGCARGRHLARDHVRPAWRCESPQRVAVLGPEGTFTEEAAVQYFGGAANFLYCNTFRGSLPRHGRRQRPVRRGGRRELHRRRGATARWTCSATRPATSWARSAC